MCVRFQYGTRPLPACVQHVPHVTQCQVGGAATAGVCLCPWRRTGTPREASTSRTRRLRGSASRSPCPPPCPSSWRGCCLARPWLSFSSCRLFLRPWRWRYLPVVLSVGCRGGSDSPKGQGHGLMPPGCAILAGMSSNNTPKYSVSQIIGGVAIVNVLLIIGMAILGVWPTNPFIFFIFTTIIPNLGCLHYYGHLGGRK